MSRIERKAHRFTYALVLVFRNIVKAINIMVHPDKEEGRERRVKLRRSEDSEGFTWKWMRGKEEADLEGMQRDDDIDQMTKRIERETVVVE